MAYDLYPAVDENYNFPPEVRGALATSTELRNTVVPMTQTLRNNLTGAELWDGRLILNTTTGRINRYDAGSSTWVAVGELAEIQAVSAALSAKTGRRNAIRNGDMSIAQRGITNITTGGYCLDGWIKGHTGGTHTTTGGPANNTGTNVGTLGATHRLESIVAGQSLAGHYAYISQKIENARVLSGKEVTLSFISLADVANTKIGVEIIQNFGTGGAPSAEVFTTVGAITLDAVAGVAKRYSVTFTVPSIAGKTFGTNDDSFLQVQLWLSSGATFAARASDIGIQNRTIHLTDVQLEEGGLSSFERLPQAEQLAWCQRYFYRITGLASGTPGSELGLVISSSAMVAMVRFPVTMRTTPTFSSAGFGVLQAYWTSTNATTLVSTAYASPHGMLLQANRTANDLTVQRQYYIASGSPSEHLTFSAEL